MTDPQLRRYKVRFAPSVEVTVTLAAENEDKAAESAHDIATAYLDTAYGNGWDVTMYASLDGIGAYSVEPGES